MAGAETWHRILNAIERLQAKAEGEKGALGAAGRASSRPHWPLVLFLPAAAPFQPLAVLGSALMRKKAHARALGRLATSALFHVLTVVSHV
jgi:hypothetical protein